MPHKGAPAADPTFGLLENMYKRLSQKTYYTGSNSVDPRKIEIHRRIGGRRPFVGYCGTGCASIGRYPAMRSVRYIGV